MSTQRSSRNRTGAVAVLVTSLLLIIGAVAYIGFAMTSSSGETLSRDFEGTGNGVEQIVEIPEGSSMSALGPELEERGIVKSDAAFQTAAANNPNSANIQPGFFRLQEEMSAAAAVEALLNPENQIDLLDIPGGATLADLTVVGGDTRYGIYTMISNVTCGTSNQEQCITAGELEDVGANADAGALGVPEWALAQVNERRGSPKRLEA